MQQYCRKKKDTDLLKIPVGRAAEPDTIKRIGDCCITSDGFNVLGSSGATSSIFAYIVGTAMNTVGSLCTPSLSSLSRVPLLLSDKALFHLLDDSANLSHTLIGLNLINSTLAPAHVAHPNLLITAAYNVRQYTHVTANYLP